MNSTIYTDEEDAKVYSEKFKYLFALLGLAGMILVGRLWYLQIIKGQELRTYSEKNRVKETKIPAPRGLILDRDGRVITENLPGHNATISPQYATQLENTAAALGDILGVPADEIVKKVKASRKENGPFRPVRIKENLSLDEVFRVKLARMDHPGLDVEDTIVRHYPLGENGAQLFGYVSEISKEQIDQYNQKSKRHRYEQGDIVGQSGIERYFEEDIRGSDGISFVEVDARGRRATSESPQFLNLKTIDEKPGRNLVLTLDEDIQIAAHQAMHQKDQIGTRIGSLVAIKSNGEILAWVSLPSYNPNDFSTGISRELWTRLSDHPFKPLRNKVIQDHYAPGSTFKPIVALAALQEKVITETKVINAPGFIKFGRRIYHDHLKGGHGNITVLEAIERSSNIFFYKMGIQLGVDVMAGYSKLLGLGTRTGIEVPNEQPGLIPTSAWKLKAYGEEWQAGENLSTAIGQGYVLTTALQLALAYNTIGLEGKLYKPFLVKKIIDKDNAVIEEKHEVLVRDLTSADHGEFRVDRKTFETVKKGMWRVSNGERGTAKWFRIPGVEMAGKTGTTQLRSYSADQIYEKCEERPLRDRHHGWFVGFAPAAKPEITVAVLAEHSCHGSTGSAPVVRDVIRAYFEKYHPDLVKKVSPTQSVAPPASVEVQSGEVDE